MRYFITGATGFIGGKLTDKLLKSGHQITALVRNPVKAEELKLKGVTLIEGDITDKESMRKGMEGVDGIFHMAAWYKVGVNAKDLAYRINVEGTRNVLELMKELGIKKGVYTSTLAVFSDTHGKLVDETYQFTGKHLSAYDATKWKAHYEVARPLMKEGLPLVVVLPGLVYGPGDTSSLEENLRVYLKGKLPMLPKKTAFCWAHVDDIVDGHILAMEKGNPGEGYIIAGPPHTFIEGMEIAEKITGVKLPWMRVGPGMIKLMADFMKPVSALFPFPPTYTPEGLRVVAGVTYLGDNSKAKRELGYNPRPVEEGLKETLEHLMKEMGIR
ncbi:NAD-dependent epimerase/dehydratase family protein [candidate division KSB1 bacterium]|nr:NAD-dependent epimerase/dehydratase family protein [candidate division KSB1 bacterium]